MSLPNKNIQRDPSWGFLLLFTVAQTLAKFFRKKKNAVCWCHLEMLPETPDLEAPHHPPGVHPHWLMPTLKDIFWTWVWLCSAKPRPILALRLVFNCFANSGLQSSPHPLRCLFIFLPSFHQSSNLALSRGSGKALHRWWGWQEGLGSGIQLGNRVWNARAAAQGDGSVARQQRGERRNDLSLSDSRALRGYEILLLH